MLTRMRRIPRLFVFGTILSILVILLPVLLFTRSETTPTKVSIEDVLPTTDARISYVVPDLSKIFDMLKQCNRTSSSPVCEYREVNQNWIPALDKGPKSPILLMDKSSVKYQELRSKWSVFVSRDSNEANCVIPLDAATPSGEFFQELFGLYASHSTYCPFKVRLGGAGDGGKWLCDIVPCKRCLIYSLGSGEHFEFEKAVIDFYGCDIHTFDCTTSGAKTPPKVTFHPWCIGTKDELVDGHQFYTLTTIMKELNHTYMDVLKMDIERYEYAVVKTLGSLSKDLLPKQITFEVHLNPMNGFKDYVPFVQFQRLWDRLHGMGYKAISHNINPVDQCCSDYTLLRS